MPDNSELANVLSGSALLGTIAHPATTNLLDIYGNAASTGNRIWLNREFQARQAAGQNFQQSINPDGTTNQAALLQGARNNPAMALDAQDSAQKGQTLSAEEQSQRYTRLSYAAAGASQLLAQYPGGPPLAAVKKFWDDAVRDGHATAGDEQAALSAYNDDPTNNRQVILQRLSGNIAAQQAMTNQAGTVTLQPVGGSVQPLRTAGPGANIPLQTAPAAGSPSIPMTLSPGEGETRIGTVDNNLYLPDGKTPNPNYGQPITVPLRTIAAQPGGGGPNAPNAPSPANPPRLAPPPAPSGTLPTGLPPGADIPIKAANDAWAAVSANTGTYAQRSFPVTQALALAQKGNLTTGQGTKAINDVKSWLQSRAATFGWDAQSIANADYQKLEKYLQQNVNAQPMAAGSDARLASALTGNPSAHLDNLALVDVLKATQGLMRMDQMAAIDFAARGAPNGQWNNFVRDWQITHDPRAFIADQMNTSQQKKMFADMKPSERVAFGRTLDLIDAHPEIMNTAAMPSH
jgi:hypothetical protein